MTVKAGREDMVSAQVVLRPAAGQPVTDPLRLTAESIQDFMPDTEALSKALGYFAGEGFETGVAVGNNFSITAPARVFEKFFKVDLNFSRKKGIIYFRPDGTAASELPLSELSGEIAEMLIAIVFVPPPEFGPAEFK